MIAAVCWPDALITCLESRDFKDTHRESVAVAPIDSPRNRGPKSGASRRVAQHKRLIKLDMWLMSH